MGKQNSRIIVFPWHVHTSILHSIYSIFMYLSVAHGMNYSLEIHGKADDKRWFVDYLNNLKEFEKKS